MHFDSLGRPIYNVVDYGGGKTAAVFSIVDLTGSRSQLFDEENREIANGFASMAGRPVESFGSETGRRWCFQNALGALVKNWDEHGRRFRVEYDVMHRPVATFAKAHDQPEILFQYIVYGDRVPDGERRNLLGAPHQVFDQGGALSVREIDFQGNPTAIDRILAKDYKTSVDWRGLAAAPDYAAIQRAAAALLEAEEVFEATARYDALGRPTTLRLPDRTVVRPRYDKANFLASLRARIRDRGKFVEFLKFQEYNSKGQRQRAEYGNRVLLSYLYDPDTFRLTHLLAHKAGADPDAQALQDLRYVYDPVGNVMQIDDDAQQTYFFDNAVVRPRSLYEYDAIYQLVRASGRELAASPNDAALTNSDLDRIARLPSANDAHAVRVYTETYDYDLLGNIRRFRHRFRSRFGGGGGWTRRYRYAFEDAPGDCTNRLTATSMPGDRREGPLSGVYRYDRRGNMRGMPHLREMGWNVMDQLHRVDLGGGGVAHYVYGADGMRLRKVVETRGGVTLDWIFLGPVMLFRRRRRRDHSLRLERWTLELSDNAGPIAQIDVKTRDEDDSDPDNPLDVALTRYQYTNHLNSSTFETDEGGDPISYEEYHPYGTTAYRASKPGDDLSLKRYRFSGKERDQETGLYYFGARYYAAWLGRWTSADPAGVTAGLNLYRYCRNAPSVLTDPLGLKELDGKVFVDPNSPEAKLADPGKASEAKAFLEAVYTSRLKDKSLEFHIDKMHFDESTHMWLIDSWHLSHKKPPSTAPPNQSGTQGSGGDGASAPKSPASGASKSAVAQGSGKEGGAKGSPRPDALTHAGPSTEKGIWLGRNFRDRGYTLEHLYSDRILDALKAKGDNREYYDTETNTHVKQIKSSNGNAETLRATASQATRDAGEAITHNPSMAGKTPQAVVISPTDAPSSAEAAVRAGYDNIRRPVSNSAPPEHIRGLPGRVGSIGRALTVGGTALSAYALATDLAHGDYAMASGDALSTVGGGLEIYAIATPGATVAGVSAMSAGMAVGGLGIAVASGIGGVRAYQRGDYSGAVAGGVGVLAGIAITAGVIFGAPALLIGGVIAAALVGLFHLGRWLFG